MAGEPVKVVLVGCGGRAKAWLQPAVENPMVQIVGLVDLHRANAEQRAKDFGLDEKLIYASLDEAVQASGAEVVFDVTVPAAHDKVTIRAFELGCHVLGEKPMSDTLEKARNMVAAAKQHNKLYAVTQTRRPAPFAQRTVSALRSGMIGDVQEIHSDFYIGARFGGSTGENFRNVMEHPLILDMAIHTFDTARQLSGADPVRVYCRTWNPRRSWYKGDASACAIFDMQLPDGSPIVYTYRGSWTNEGMQTDWNSDWRIVGQKGTLHTNGNSVVETEVVADESSREFFRPLKKVEAPAVPALGESAAWFIENFIQSLRSGETPACSGEDNIKSLAMVEACVQSSKRNAPVDVQW